MKRWRLAVLVWASFCLALGAKAQFSAPPNPIFGRKYTVGERYCYRLTLKEYHDDKLALTNVSVCQLRVVTNDKGVPFDQVQWLSKKVVYDKDTVDQSGSARAVNPYLISLDPRGTVMLPKIEDPKMTEAIEDFNTFFVALGPMFYGVNRLVNKGDSLVVGFPIVADFSNGSTILKGQDCFYIHFKVNDVTGDDVLLNTAFLPPRNKPGLIYFNADMNAPVVPGIFNNFQMVEPAGKELFNVEFGREYFTINSTIKKLDGKLVKAEMFNFLNLKVRSNCDKDYKNWSDERPYSERRILTLELL